MEEKKIEETAEVKKAKAPKLSYANGDKPVKKTQISQDYMLDFILGEHPADLEWFVKLCEDNKKLIPLPSDASKKYEGIDVFKVRTAFCAKYFPKLNEKREQEPKETYLERVRKALADAKANKG